MPVSSSNAVKSPSRIGCESRLVWSDLKSRGRITAIPRKWTAKLPGSPYLGIHGYRFERFFPEYGVTRAVPGTVTPLVELDSIVPGTPAATLG